MQEQSQFEDLDSVVRDDLAEALNMEIHGDSIDGMADEIDDVENITLDEFLENFPPETIRSRPSLVDAPICSTTKKSADDRTIGEIEITNLPNSFASKRGSFFKSSSDEVDETIYRERPAGWPAVIQGEDWEIWLLSIFHLAYGFIYGSMGLCILPLESGRLQPNAQSLTLGLFLSVCGVSQLSCPIIGKLSDAWRSAKVLDRRIIFLKMGGAFTLIGVTCMYIASVWIQSCMLYCLSLFMGMIGLNMCFSAQGGLAPDLLDKKQLPLVSGYVAGNILAGSSLGFITIMVTANSDFHYLYPIYATLTSTTIVIEILIGNRLQARMENGGLIQVPENYSMENELEMEYVPSWLDNAVCPWVYGECTWRSLARCFWIDYKTQRDFFWVFVSRTMYYIGVSVQTFIQLFVRDVANTPSEEDQKFRLASIALTAQTTAAICAVIIGRQQARLTSKRSSIYVAATIMVTVYVGFLICPLFEPYGYYWLLAIAPLYGMGNGSFLSVDYAIALDVIGDPAQAAELLGIWGISAFIGSSLGPLLFGSLIEIFGGDIVKSILEGQFQEYMATTHTYNYPGYAAMLIGGSLATIMAGLLIKKVRHPI